MELEDENVTKLVLVALWDRVEERKGFANEEKDPIV